MHSTSAERPVPLAIKRARLRADIATHRLLMAAMWLRLLTEKANFDPSQPRVPAGDPAGGQWTGGGGNGTRRLRRVAGANEEDTRPNRSIVDETLDPTGELRTEAYSNALQQIRQLEPDNPQLQSINTSNYVPSWQTVNGLEAELESARGRVADQIAAGHAFDEHADEFGVSSPTELSSIIRSILGDTAAQVQNLARGRTSFYLSSSNTLVIVDPSSSDSGTIFKPNRGQSYVDDLLKSK